MYSVATVIVVMIAALCILRISCWREKRSFFADTLSGPTLGFLMQCPLAENSLVSILATVASSSFDLRWQRCLEILTVVRITKCAGLDTDLEREDKCNKPVVE